MQPPVIPGLNVAIRWMIRHDLPKVVGIEEGCWEYGGWTEGVYLDVLKSRDTVALVAEKGDDVVGCLVYLMKPAYYRLTRMVVAPQYQRRLIGSKMVNYIKPKLALGKRSTIKADVSESWMGVLGFFSKLGFKATKVLRGRGVDGEDSYRMEYFL